MPGVALVDGEAGGVVVIASRNLPTTSSSSPAPSLAVIAASPMWPTSIDRCLIAHFLADLPEDERDELKWDERALAAVDGVSDARAREFDPRLQVRGFLPSLYASLADDHRRLGDADRARDFLGKARATSDALGEMRTATW